MARASAISRATCHFDDGAYIVDLARRIAFRTESQVPESRPHLRRTTRLKPAVLPNIGGSLPNECFAETLGLPTIWVPHSYAGCSQHAPNEHVLAPILREGLQVMTGLFWDLAEDGVPKLSSLTIDGL